MLTLKHLIMQLVQAKPLKRPKTSSYGSLQIQPCFPLCTARDTLQETHLHLSDRHSILISGTWSGARKSYFSCKTQKMQALLVCVCVCVYVYLPKGNHGPRHSQRRLWKLGIQIVMCHSTIALFCQESLRKIDAKGVEPFRNGSVHEFYHLKALITLAQVNTSLKTLMVRL